jgi:hypothetical protein
MPQRIIDARVKPGHDAEFAARASLHRFNFQTAPFSQAPDPKNPPERACAARPGQGRFDARFACAGYCVALSTNSFTTFDMSNDLPPWRGG